MTEFETKLRENEIRPTAMRIRVLEAMSRQQTAVSLSDLEKIFFKSDRITLYRTLKTFEENKLVHSIDDGTGIPKYALFKEKDPTPDLHLHFHCRICSETLCLPGYTVPDLPLPERYTSEETNLVIKGVCKRCNQNAIPMH